MKLMIFLIFLQYDEALHGGYGGLEGGGGMYEPHRAGLPLGAHHVPHVPHPAAAAMHYAPANHVSPVPNHVMATEPHVHKRDKDAIYGSVLPGFGWIRLDSTDGCGVVWFFAVVL